MITQLLLVTNVIIGAALLYQSNSTNGAYVVIWGLVAWSLLAVESYKPKNVTGD
jgi:hypothetical protein